MSANVYWRPAARRGFSLSVMSPSRFIEVLREIAGGPPWILGDGELAALRGARAASGKGIREGFEELIEAIEKHGTVQVEVEY